MLVVVALLASSVACSDPEAAKQRYFEAGNERMAGGQVSEAIIQYRNALRWDPQFGEARLKLAEAYEQSQNQAAAFREYLVASDLLPDNPGLQVKAGELLLAAGEFEDARGRADRALSLDPQSVQALILRANAMAGLREVSGAIGEIEEAIAAQPSAGDLYLSLGALRLAGGARAEAEAAFKQAVGLNPSSVEAHLALAYFYWTAGEPAEVERTLKDALALEPSHPMTNRMLSAYYLARQRDAEAEAPLKAYVEAVGTDAARVTLADYYRRMQRPSESSAVLKPLLQSPTAYGDAALRLAEIERAAGRRDAAEQLLDDLLAKDPRHTMGLIARAQWRLEERRAADALDAARAAVDANPVSALAQFALANALIENNQTEPAILTLTEVLRLSPRMVNAQILLARAQLATNRSADALRTSLEAKKLAPENPDVRAVLARSLLFERQGRQAEPEVRALLQTRPNLATTHELHGLLLSSQGNREAARAAFNRALERNPNSVEALRALLAFDLGAGNIAPAVARIERHVDQASDDAQVLFVAAQTYAAARQSDKMEQTLRRVIDLAPDHIDAYLMLGRLYVGLNRLDAAIEEFDAASSRRPGNVAAPTMAAMIVHMQNRIPEARKRYEAIVAGGQRAPIAANNLAWLLAEEGGNLDVALQLAQSAKVQLPDSPLVNHTLGWIYYKRDLPGQSIPPLELAASRMPDNPTYHLHLGLAYAKAGQNDRARASLERALKLGPESEGATEAKQALAGLRTN